jgi:hypothetical protein
VAKPEQEKSVSHVINIGGKLSQPEAEQFLFGQGVKRRDVICFKRDQNNKLFGTTHNPHILMVKDDKQGLSELYEDLQTSEKIIITEAPSHSF